MATLVIMRDKLRRQIGNPTTTAVSDGQLVEHLNDAYREIANKYRFHRLRKLCTFDTEIGTSRYGLPTDCSVVLRVRDTTNEVKLEKFGDRRMADRADATMQAKPKSYARYRDFVELDPIPDGVYTIELFYKSAITELVADGDVPVIPDSWHEGIVKLARFKYFEDQVDLPKAKAAYDLFGAWIQDQPVEVDEEKLDMDSGVSVPTLEQSLTQRLDFNYSD